jgi:hypothetical protein
MITGPILPAAQNTGGSQCFRALDASARLPAKLRLAAASVAEFDVGRAHRAL